MNKIICIASVAILAAACGSNRSSAEQTSEGDRTVTATEAVADEPAAQEKRMMTGAYSDQRALKEDEKTLFAKVTEGLVGVTYTPESVATQVVAGMNYRFICTGKTATDPEKTIKVEIVVFQPLPDRGEPRITSITKLTE